MYHITFISIAELCDFENGDCGYTQDPTEDFDWVLQQGGTPSQGTGPATDHTYYTAYGKNSVIRRNTLLTVFEKRQPSSHWPVEMNLGLYRKCGEYY